MISVSIRLTGYCGAIMEKKMGVEKRDWTIRKEV